MFREEDLLTYNGLFVGEINKAYYDIINSDIVKQPYQSRDQGDLTWFYKRRGYAKRTFSNATTLPVGYDVTDIVHIGDFLYYMCINRGLGEIKIYKEILANNTLYLITSDSWDDGMYERFVVTNFVTGKPRTLFVGTNTITSDYGIQVNDTNTFLGSFTDVSVDDGTYDRNYNLGNDSILGGDYLYVYDNRIDFTSGISGVPGTVGRVGSLNDVSDELINVQGLWPNFKPGQLEGKDCKYYIFPEIGEVLLYATTDGIKCLHYDEIDTDPTYTIITNCGQTDSGFAAIQEHNGFITYYNQAGGVISYGGVGTNQMNGFFNQYIPVNKNIINMASFNAYLLGFSTNNITAAIIQTQTTDTGAYYTGFSQSVMENEGVWSKDSFDVSSEGAYIVTNQRRFGALELSTSTGSQIDAKFTDMSDGIVGHLLLLESGDNVRVCIDNREIRIYINGDTQGTGILNKTKILIYDRYKKFRRTHISFNSLVKGGKIIDGVPNTIRGLYVGDTCYNYCGRKDINSTGSFDYDQEFTRYLGETTDGATLSIYKKLHYSKLLLGLLCSIHDTTTTFQIDRYMYGYKPIFKIDNVEDVSYITMINAINDGLDITPSDCEVSLLEECGNYTNPCDDSRAVEGDDSCGTPLYQEDYGICVDSKKYFLSAFANVYVPLNTGTFSELYKFTLKATGADKLHFGGNIIGYEIQLPSWQPEAGTTRQCTKCLGDVEPCGNC